MCQKEFKTKTIYYRITTRKSATRVLIIMANNQNPYGAVIAPVHHSSSYGFPTFDEMRRYAKGELPDEFFYSRYANPTVAEAERAIAALEGAEDCVVVSSGSAATFCALAALCEAGDEIILPDSVYGGTLKIAAHFFPRYGVTARFIGIDDIPNLPEIVTERSKVFWFESPANPLNRLVDLTMAAEAARTAGVFSIIDNTFASPALQQPIKFGVNGVMHSATKYLGGHTDLTAGAIAGSREFVGQVRAVASRIGATLDPAAAYLLLRGMKTLNVRAQAACANARRVAEFLQAHEKVARVYYPGLADNPDYALAQKQMPDGCGGIVAFDLRGGEAEAERFFDALRLIRNAPSLGGVESLASYPLYSSHFGFTDEQLRAAGISAATVRLAIGIEPIEDLTADLAQALGQI
jgi:cystathionine beta-lyase/cystathionine gamma-synthase